MAGPIRNLLQRRPLRNAVRGLLGLQPRYGSSRMDSMAYTDEAQGADLDAQPTRRTPAPVSNTAYESRTTAKPVAPSPEARAVSMARTEDSGRRQTAKRQEEGVAPAPPAQPRPPETGGFALTMDIGDTDAPPPHPLMVQAERYRRQAEAERAQAAQLQQNPIFRNPSNPNFGVLAARANALEERATRLDTYADGLIGQARGEEHSNAMADKRAGLALDLARIQNPADSLTTDANAFAETVRSYGIGMGAQLATDGWFAATNSAADPGSADYQARLMINQINAAGVVLADRITKRQPFGQQGDPVMVELASVLSQYAPRDPAMRARTISSIVSSAQQRAGFDPQWGRRLASMLTAAIEREIAANK